MKDHADQRTIDAFPMPVKKVRGGRRSGAGMKQKYGEPTITMRIPVSRREGMEIWLAAMEEAEKLGRLTSQNEQQAERKAYLDALLEAAESVFFTTIKNATGEIT